MLLLIAHFTWCLTEGGEMFSTEGRQHPNWAPKRPREKRILVCYAKWCITHTKLMPVIEMILRYIIAALVRALYKQRMKRC